MAARRWRAPRWSKRAFCPLGEQQVLRRASEPRLLLSSNLPFNEFQERVPSPKARRTCAFALLWLRQATDRDPHDSRCAPQPPRIFCSEKEGSGEHETRPERSRGHFLKLLTFCLNSVIDPRSPFTLIRLWVRHCTYGEHTIHQSKPVRTFAYIFS